MKGIKLWKIVNEEKDGPSILDIESVDKTETEHELEEVITRSPEMIMDDLKIIGRQVETAGGPLDLLGVDGDGNLVVLELKRGTLTRDAVAQIIDYASFLAELDSEELASHVSERSANLGTDRIENLCSWYQEQFSEPFPSRQRPKMVLVGLGVDERARRMISFLADSEIDVSLLTFHGFREGDHTYLARQVEIEAKPPTGTAASTKKINLEKLQKRVTDLGIDDYYYKLAAFLRYKLSAYEWPNPGGYSYSLSEITSTGTESLRVYIALYRLDSHPGKVRMQIYPRAVEVAREAYQSLKAQLRDRIVERSDGGADIWVNSLNDVEELQQNLEKYCEAIVDGWKKKREKESMKEFQAAEKEIKTEIQSDEAEE